MELSKTQAKNLCMSIQSVMVTEGPALTAKKIFSLLGKKVPAAIWNSNQLSLFIRANQDKIFVEYCPNANPKKAGTWVLHPEKSVCACDEEDCEQSGKSLNDELAELTSQLAVIATKLSELIARNGGN